MPNERLKLTARENLFLVADFLLDEDWLYFVLANYSHEPALRVNVQFSQSLPGLSERQDFTKLPIFSKLQYLAPFKEIKLPINRIETVLAKLRKTEIEVRIAYENEQKKRTEQRILHDLGIYQDFPILLK